MSLILTSPQAEVTKITTFIKETLTRSGQTKALVAVSGGIDSALSLTLSVRALGPTGVFPVFMPYNTQNMTDALDLAKSLGISEANYQTFQIEGAVAALAQTAGLEKDAPGGDLRLGNMMARVRMILLYDLAKKISGLVIGTENLSEQYLGYFTRFGDEASDLEPLQHLYKTQVRQLAEFLELPPVFLRKAPSAGLWAGQTDEAELGFSYAQADLVLEAALGRGLDINATALETKLSPQLIIQVLQRVQAASFKHEVPYTFAKN